VSLQTTKYSDGTPRKLVELRWHREVIERWVHCSQIGPDAHEQLKEMLSRVDRELEEIEATRYMD
jgi:hypothetical protein